MADTFLAIGRALVYRRSVMRWILPFLLWPALAVAQVAVPSSPSPQNGFGTLSVSNSSINVSTVSTGPNSNSWKMPLFGNLVILNESGSAGAVYVCPLGGVCTSANGLPVPVGTAVTFNLGGSSVSPTIIAGSTATVWIGW